MREIRRDKSPDLAKHGSAPTTSGAGGERMKVIFDDSFVAPSQARALFASLQQLPWTRGKFRGHAVPRDEIWIGPYAYRFSGRTLEPIAWRDEVEAARTQIQRRYGGNYNSVLLNRYVDETDSVSWHSDDEPEMDSEHPIASLSLGAAREFKIRPIQAVTPQTRLVRTYALTSGSLLIMPPGFQARFQHCVPKSRTLCGTRINLTFRRMK